MKILVTLTALHHSIATIMVMLEGGRGVGESHGQNVYTSFPRSYLILILILIPMPNLDGAHVRRVEKKREIVGHVCFKAEPSRLYQPTYDQQTGKRSFATPSPSLIPLALPPAYAGTAPGHRHQVPYH